MKETNNFPLNKFFLAKKILRKCIFSNGKVRHRIFELNISYFVKRSEHFLQTSTSEYLIFISLHFILLRYLTYLPTNISYKVNRKPCGLHCFQEKMTTQFRSDIWIHLIGYLRAGGSTARMWFQQFVTCH